MGTFWDYTFYIKTTTSFASINIINDFLNADYNRNLYHFDL